MTKSRKNDPNDLFDDDLLDPMTVATGGGMAGKGTPAPKKKAGFYISESILDRFNRRFHQLKLDGVPIENKSALVEMALTLALDDLDRGEKSALLAELQQ